MARSGLLLARLRRFLRGLAGLGGRSRRHLARLSLARFRGRGRGLPRLCCAWLRGGGRRLPRLILARLRRRRRALPGLGRRSRARLRCCRRRRLTRGRRAGLRGCCRRLPGPGRRFARRTLAVDQVRLRGRALRQRDDGRGPPRQNRAGGHIRRHSRRARDSVGRDQHNRAAMPPGVARSDFDVSGDPGVFGAVDCDPVRAPIRSAPAPERRHDGKAAADLEPRLDRLRHKLARRRQIDRREFAVLPLAVNDGRVIDRHIDPVLLRRGNKDGRPFLADLQVLHLLQLAGFHRELAQCLDPRHDLGLLRRKGDANRLGPLDMLAHHLDDLREGDQRLDARIPGQRLQSLDQRIALELRMAVLLQPLRGLGDLLRVGRGHQHLREQLIGVERDGRDQLVDLLPRVMRRPGIGGLVERGRCLRAGRGLRSRRLRQGQGRDQQKGQCLP